jgi:hypothetical protein
MSEHEDTFEPVLSKEREPSLELDHRDKFESPLYEFAYWIEQRVPIEEAIVILEDLDSRRPVNLPLTEEEYIALYTKRLYGDYANPGDLRGFGDKIRNWRCQDSDYDRCISDAREKTLPRYPVEGKFIYSLIDKTNRLLITPKEFAILYCCDYLDDVGFKRGRLVLRIREKYNDNYSEFYGFEGMVAKILDIGRNEITWNGAFLKKKKLYHMFGSENSELLRYYLVPRVPEYEKIFTDKKAERNYFSSIYDQRQNLVYNRI